ncbi:MAG: DUF3683 domain-containing protein [Comamonadaceae bacterium]|nr:DUF3683 domain-containing protein [Comamonadaceae bacterium]
MNALPAPQPAATAAALDPPAEAARDPVQLHLVLRPRDRHPPARRATPGRCSTSCASERRTGRSARMLYEVLGDIWVVQRNPVPAGRPARQPEAPRAADRGAAPPPARGREAPRRRRRRRARRQGRRAAAPRARGASTRFARSVRATVATCASARAACSAAHTRDGQHLASTACARVSHVTDATDWRVEYPVRRADARHRGRDAGAGARPASSWA